MGYPTERPFIITRRNNGSVTVPVKRFVRNDGSLCYQNGQKALGVSWDQALAGKDFPVAVKGTVLVESGVALAADIPVTTDSQGRAIRPSRGQYVNGRTLTGCSASGQDVEVLLKSGLVLWTTTTTTTSTTSTTTSTSSTTTTTTTAP